MKSQALSQGGSTGNRLREFLRLVNRRKALIFPPTVLFTGIALLIYLATPPRFESTAVIALDVRKVQVVDHEVVSRLPQESAALRTELDVMRSRSLNEKVVDRLNLTVDPAVLREAGAEHALMHDVAEIIQNALGRFSLVLPELIRPQRRTARRLLRVRNSPIGW